MEPTRPARVTDFKQIMQVEGMAGGFDHHRVGNAQVGAGPGLELGHLHPERMNHHALLSIDSGDDHVELVGIQRHVARDAGGEGVGHVHSRQGRASRLSGARLRTSMSHTDAGWWALTAQMRGFERATK
jgi:hypothetical protein